MFGLRRRKHDSSFMNTKFLLNRNVCRQKFESPPDNKQYPLEQHLHKFPVETFSNESESVEIIPEQIGPIVETANSKAITDIARGINNGDSLVGGKTSVAITQQKGAIDDMYTLTKDQNEISAKVGPKLVQTELSKSDRYPHKTIGKQPTQNASIDDRYILSKDTNEIYPSIQPKLIQSDVNKRKSYPNKSDHIVKKRKKTIFDL